MNTPIDDYTTVHSKHRPTGTKASSSIPMCTIVCRIFPSIQAVPNQSVEKLHCPLGIDNESLINELTNIPSMHAFGKSFTENMPDWIRDVFFDPELVRHRLDAHSYHHSSDVREMRCLNNLYLIEFTELQLKSKQDFATALNILQTTAMKEYLKRYSLLMPGDWPSQFYIRQNVYSEIRSSSPKTSYKYEIDHRTDSLKHNFHEYGSNENQNVHIYFGNGTKLFTKPIEAIVPCIGPLHISLNAREDVMANFHTFLKYLYEHIFLGCKLAEKPRPWRTSYILEIAYGGWSLIREKIREVFSSCKYPLYAVFLNLLDSYLPLVLSIYRISFKRGKFSDYFASMKSVWLMFLCFKRHHYNKVPLIWLSSILFWKKNNKPLYEIFKNPLNVTDEYGVENAHSIIRSQTCEGDGPEILKRKAKAIFQSKSTQRNFRNQFTPQNNSIFSSSKLNQIKFKVAELLTGIFSRISELSLNNDFDNSSMDEMLKCYLPNNSSISAYPLGYHTNSRPDPTSKCDMPGCFNTNESIEWTIFPGCAHSYHHLCLQGHDHCPICRLHLKTIVKKLVSSANIAFANGSGQPVDNKRYDDPTNDMPTLPNSNDKNCDAEVHNLFKKIKDLKPVAKLKVVLVVPGTTVGYLSKFFSVSERIANFVSAFVDKLHNLNGFIIPVSLPGPVLLTPCAETVYRNAHVRSRARK